MNKEITKEIRKNWDFVLKNSLENCHAYGVHSIVLSKEENYLRRIFVTSDWHELWKNHFPDNSSYPTYELSVAIHPHHCAVKLNTIKGQFENLQFTINPSLQNEFFTRYLYSSPITGKAGYFVKQGVSSLKLLERKVVKIGNSISLSSKQLHTVYLEKGKQAAWLVEESDENPFYKAECYSNAKLELFSFDGMYRPMTSETLEEIVEYLDR